MIPLSRALLCANCDVIYDAGERRCPGCTSTTVLVLANVLDRRPAEAREG